LRVWAMANGFIQCSLLAQRIAFHKQQDSFYSDSDLEISMTMTGILWIMFNISGFVISILFVNVINLGSYWVNIYSLVLFDTMFMLFLLFCVGIIWFFYPNYSDEESPLMH